MSIRIYFSEFGKKHYLENNFSIMKNEKNWEEVGIEVSEKNYSINLRNGEISLNGEKIEIGKDINGYYEKFSGKNLEYGKNLIYYCESMPIGVGGNCIRARKIYLGYECDLDQLKIRYNLYTVEKYTVLLVYDCETEKIGISIDTSVNFHLNGKDFLIKI